MLCRRRRERLLQGKPPSDKRKSGGTGTTMHPLNDEIHEHVLSFGRSYSHYSTNSSDAFIQGQHCVSDLWKDWLKHHEKPVFQAFQNSNSFLTLNTTTNDMPNSLKVLFLGTTDEKGAIVVAPTLKLQVSYTQYLAIFKLYYLEFEKFKDDQCLVCNSFRNQLRAHRSRNVQDDVAAGLRIALIQRAWDEHRRIADHGYQWRREHAQASFLSLHPEPEGQALEPEGQAPEPNSLVGDAPEANDVVMVDYCSKPKACVFVEMDKGGGLKIPFLRDSFVYFKRTNLAYLYYFCNTGTNKTTVYGWNESYSKSGPNEMVSMYHDYYTKYRTGATHFEAWVDGCGGQLWNRHFAWAVADSCNPLSHSYVDNNNTSSMWLRADIYRNLRGHTFQRADRAHGVVRKAINRSEFVAGLDDLLDDIIPSADKSNPYNVHKLDHSILYNTKAYSKQFYIWRKTIDGQKAGIRSARWMNFAIGELWDEELQKFVTQAHPYEVWLRDTLDPKEQPRRLNIMKFCNVNGAVKNNAMDLTDNRMHQFAKQDRDRTNARIAINCLARDLELARVANKGRGGRATRRGAKRGAGRGAKRATRRGAGRAGKTITKTRKQAPKRYEPLPELRYKLTTFPLHTQRRQPLAFKKRKDLHKCAEALPPTLLSESKRKSENKCKDEYGDDLEDVTKATLQELYPLDPNERESDTIAKVTKNASDSEDTDEEESDNEEDNDSE